MGGSLNINEASKFLEGFMAEMCSWEKDFLEEKLCLIGEGGSTLECNDKYTKMLLAIFDRFVDGDSTTKARLGLVGASSPVTYDPQRDQILEPRQVKGRAVIEVNQVGGLESRFRFTLVNGQGWKIARKDTLRGDKWEKSSL